MNAISRRHLGLGRFGTIWCENHNRHTAFAEILGRRHLVRVRPGLENAASVLRRQYTGTDSLADRLPWTAPPFPAELNL